MLAQQPGISLIVPTRNRAYSIRLVARSWYEQELLSEVIFVDDAGSDDTAQAIADIASHYPNVRTIVLRNPECLGASASRNRGAADATNDFILFCDDDEYLEAGYARVCLEKLISYDAGAVSGRRVYMRDGETPDEALRRFGSGPLNLPAWQSLTCIVRANATIIGDAELPLVTANIVTRSALVRRFGFDPSYRRGNGFREESDFQMNLFVNGYRNYMTSACHSFHLSVAQAGTGGQRVNSWRHAYWAIVYNEYFYRKYWKQYARRMHIRVPRIAALTIFAVYIVTGLLLVHLSPVIAVAQRWRAGRAALGHLRAIKRFLTDR